MSVTVRVITGLGPVRYFRVEEGKWLEVPPDGFDPDRTTGEDFAAFCQAAARRIALPMLESYARRLGVDRGVEVGLSIMSIDAILQIGGFICAEDDLFTSIMPVSLIEGAPGDFTLILVRGSDGPYNMLLVPRVH